MIRGVRPYYTMPFVDVLLILPFVAVMIRGVRPYCVMTFVDVRLILPFVAMMIGVRGASMASGDW